MTDIVTLRNGYTTSRVSMAVTFLHVELLLKQNSMAFYDLVTACRNPEHQLWPESEEILMLSTLVESVDAAGRARIHEHTRSVVLSMVEGEELEMHLVNPIAP